MSRQAAELVQLAAQTSPAAIELARVLLVQDVSDAAWTQQVGPALSQRDVGRLLGKSPQAVSKDARLLRIRQRGRRPVHPVFQFDGRHQLPGLGEIVVTLSGTLEALTTAAWLTTPARHLDGYRRSSRCRPGAAGGCSRPPAASPQPRPDPTAGVKGNRPGQACARPPGQPAGRLPGTTHARGKPASPNTPFRVVSSTGTCGTQRDR